MLTPFDNKNERSVTEAGAAVEVVVEEDEGLTGDHPDTPDLLLVAGTHRTGAHRLVAGLTHTCRLVGEEAVEHLEAGL